MKLKAKDIKKAEDTIIKRIEDIVFGTPRSKPKKNGKTVIEDGPKKNLRNSIKRNKNFLKVSKDGSKVEIDINVIEYYLYLDEGTKRIEPWFLTDHILNDSEIQQAVLKLEIEGVRGAVIDMISSINK